MVKGCSENSVYRICSLQSSLPLFVKSFTDASNREKSDRLLSFPLLPVVFKKLQKQIKYLLV